MPGADPCPPAGRLGRSPMEGSRDLSGGAPRRGRHRAPRAVLGCGKSRRSAHRAPAPVPRLQPDRRQRRSRQWLALQPATCPNRRPAIQSSRACDDLLVGAADEVPPHHQLLVEGLAAEQQHPAPPGGRRAAARAGRRRGRAAHPGVSGRRRPRRAPDIVRTPYSKSGRSGSRRGAAPRRARPRRRRAGCARRAGDAAPPSVPTSTVTVASPSRRTRAARRGARSAARRAAPPSGSATHSCSAVHAAADGPAVTPRSGRCRARRSSG